MFRHPATEGLRRELVALIDEARSYVEQVGLLKARHGEEIRRLQEEITRLKAAYETDILLAKIRHEDKIRNLIEEHRVAIVGKTNDLDEAEEQAGAANRRMTELSKAMEYLHKSVGEERRLRQEDIAEAHKMVKDADRRAAEAKEQAAEANRLAEESYKWAQTEKHRARRELDRVREAEKKLLLATQNVADVSDDLRECKGLLERLMQPGEGPRLLPGVDEMLEMTPGKIDMTVAASSSSSSSSRGGPAEPLAVGQEPPFASTSFNLLTEPRGVANMMNMEDTSQRRDKGRDRWLPTKVGSNVWDEDEKEEMQAPALGGSNWRQTHADQAVDWRAATQDSGDWKSQAPGGGGLKRRATPEKATASAARKKMSDVRIWDISSDDEP
jgi:hypothetical protein